jgi:hypothetical protein
MMQQLRNSLKNIKLFDMVTALHHLSYLGKVLFVGAYRILVKDSKAE